MAAEYISDIHRQQIEELYRRRRKIGGKKEKGVCFLCDKKFARLDQHLRGKHKDFVESMHSRLSIAEEEHNTLLGENNKPLESLRPISKNKRQRR